MTKLLPIYCHCGGLAGMQIRDRRRVRGAELNLVRDSNRFEVSFEDPLDREEAGVDTGLADTAEHQLAISDPRQAMTFDRARVAAVENLGDFESMKRVGLAIEIEAQRVDQTRYQTLTQFAQFR